MKSLGWMGIVPLMALAGMAAPEYAPVPAQLVQVRDGLGNVLSKLAAGETVRVAYFGGSITAANGWRPKTTQWLRETYPNATVEEIHAAIGGTGSDLGAYRLEHDVLRHDPDLIFVEFAVNDGGAPPEQIWETMEGIVRQVWAKDPTIDIAYVYTFRIGYENDLKQGNNPRAASADEILAAHYGIPSINVALKTVEMAEAGELIYTPPQEGDAPEGVILWSNDGVHPLDAGHEIYRDVVAQALTQMAEGARPGAHELGEPMVDDPWVDATIVEIQPWMVSEGWTKLPENDGMAQKFGNRVPSLWQARDPGETLSFRFRGTGARLYDLLGPNAGQAVVTVDGQTSDPRPRFDKYCTYHRLGTLYLADNLEPGEHEVSVTIHPDQPDRSIVTDREKDNPNYDPAKYDGTKLWVGGILVRGEVLPEG